MPEIFKINEAWYEDLQTYPDARGTFFEWFKDDSIGFSRSNSFKVRQANCSISEKGVIRGIHLALLPPGQSKFVTCLNGSVLDVLVDLRKNSSTFMNCELIKIDSKAPRVVYIPSGVGHAFLSLENNTIFTYLCDQQYNPKNEIQINPFDEEIGIQWPTGMEFILSHQDENAQSLRQILELLPT